jgi:predicted nuclease of predicted toxin-antitoxin system
MRLLVDEQLAESLCQRLANLYPAGLHLRLLGFGGATGRRVWDRHPENGCLLVGKGEDFHRLSLLRGAHPKLTVLLRYLLDRWLGLLPGPFWRPRKRGHRHGK